jgi:hypothetical protein
MAADDPELTAAEERAVRMLVGTLKRASDEDPLRVDFRALAQRGRSGSRPRAWARLALAAAAALLVVATGLAVVGPGLVAGPSMRHFDNGTFSLDYRSDWSILSGAFAEGPAVQTYAVLGTGEWHSGCVFTAGGGSCNGDTADVSGGRVVVKIWNVATGPGNECDRGSDEADATLGPNAVVRSTEGAMTTWEVRMPGARFGWVGNMMIQAWADGPDALAQAESLVASFRWDDGSQAAGPDCYQPSSWAGDGPTAGQVGE